MKKILLITTGGTIASSDKGNGLTPNRNNKAFDEFVEALENVDRLDLMSLDSTNIGPEEIKDIVRAIRYKIGDYDAFIVTHGTDTMAYTAAALSYFLEGINFPVILTGSQIPIENPDSDARDNLKLAYHWAQRSIRGVYITFSGKLIRGNRAHKTASFNREAFISPNNPTDRPTWSQWIKKTEAISEPEIDPNVFLLKLFPGVDERIFDFIKDNYQGVVIEAYGIGGIPGKLENKIKELLDEGILIAITTQCLIGGVKGNVYAVGNIFSDPRIINGNDMTSEALVMKMMIGLERYSDKKSQKEFIETAIEEDRS